MATASRDITPDLRNYPRLLQRPTNENRTNTRKKHQQEQKIKQKTTTIARTGQARKNESKLSKSTSMCYGYYGCYQFLKNLPPNVIQ